MSRKRKHEEHANHEAWAIPYGDLVTLLLAFFVVMYAISTVNEGKYRAVSDSLSAAFKGAPRAIAPIQVGDKAPTAIQETNPPLDAEGNPIGERASLIANGNHEPNPDPGAPDLKLSPIDQVVKNIEESMADLIQDGMLNVRRKDYGVEIEIRTDILFPSGSATTSSKATAVLQKLADTLKSLSYPMRVEGHTDNRPINTAAFPSNWELSAARAATVVHLFMERGIDPMRLSVIGLGEYRPVADNTTEEGRNANRRVMVVILSNQSNPDGVPNSSAANATVQAQTQPVANTPVTVVDATGMTPVALN
ncbi:MAG: flagellar motor protein MotD [Steroidobacteraceae bacterium]